MTKQDRRATPRLEVLGQLHGQLVSLNVALVVRDLGAGGFSIESAVLFPPGARHQFRFSTPAAADVVVEAAVVHSRPAASVGGVTRYVTGFAFCHDSNQNSVRAVDALLGALAGVLEFD